MSQITSPNSIYNRTFGYDGAGRLISASGVWGSGSYTYDALNNMTRAVLGSRIIDIQYNSINQVSNVRDSVASSNWRAYSHDARGNVIGDGKHSFTYDSANQPVSISGNDSGTYTYDGNLRRAKEVVGGQTIYSVYSRSGTLLTRDNVSNGKKTDYLNVAGQTFVRNTNGVPAYPLNDALGTAYMVADSNGNLTATYNYTPFGESLGAGPGASSEQGYTGHIEDKTGLTYMQARYFDPIIGRFLSPDPIGYEDQLNLYAYVYNDPINRTDPSGLEGYSGFRPGEEGFNPRLLPGQPDNGTHGVRFDDSAKAAASARGIFVMGTHGGSGGPRSMPYMNGWENGRNNAFRGAAAQLAYMQRHGYKGNMPILAAWCNAAAYGNARDLAQRSKNMVIATTGQVEYRDVDKNGILTLTAAAGHHGDQGPGTFSIFMPNGKEISGITSITINTKAGTYSLNVSASETKPAKKIVCDSKGSCK